MIDRATLLSTEVFLPHEIVEVPEFGGSIKVKGMTAKAYQRFLQSMRKKNGSANQIDVDEETFAALLLTHCMYDDSDDLLLKPTEHDLVLGWPAAIFMRLSQAALRVNGMASAEGNLEATDDADFSTASH